MSTGAIAFGLILLFLSTYIIVMPLRAPRAGAYATAGLRPVSPPGGPLTALELESQRDTTYAALADLDIDHELGKINVEDYQRTRAALLTQAVFALQKLDQAQTDLEREVESLGQARRTALATCRNCGGSLQPHDKFCARCGAAAQVRCTNCNTRAGADDRFCRACGTALV